MTSIWVELKRRNVVRVAIAYAVVAWLLLQVADVVLNNIEAPDWVFQAILLLLAIGFPLAIIFAWAFELTSEGIKKEKDVDRSHSNTAQTGRKLDFIIIGMLLVALAYFVADKFVLAPGATLEAVQSTAEPAQLPDSIPQASIAVLPFTNRSAQEDSQFFVDGMHDDLLTQLARIGDLKVISRTSVLEYRDTTKNMRQIGQELGVATLLEGAVQRAGNRVRINAQLIDAATDEHLWAQSFDRELTPEGIFEIQTDIARAIATALAATLAPREPGSDRDRIPTQNQAAYDLYLQARAIPRTFLSSNIDRRIELYKQAVQLDPDFALAIGEIGYQYCERYWFETRSPEDRAESRGWIERALALAPEEPRLLWIWAEHLYHGYFDYDGALEVLEKVEEAMPGSVDLYSLRGNIFRRSGRSAEGIAEAEKAMLLDPRNRAYIADHIYSFIYTGDPFNARRIADRLRALPDLSPSLQFWVHCYELYLLGETQAVSRSLEGVTVEDMGIFQFFFVEVPFLERRFDDALAMLEKMPDDPISFQYISWPHSHVRARISHASGNIDQARQEAELALAELDALIAAQPEDARPVASRALMLAILGRDREARDEAIRATELYPITQDVPTAAAYHANRLRVLAIVGESDELAEELAKYLALEAKLEHIDYLFLDPVFDRHREHEAIKAFENQYTFRGRESY